MMSIGEYSHEYPWATEAIPRSVVDLRLDMSGSAGDPDPNL